MKKFLVLPFCLLFNINMSAQELNGKVSYEQIVNYDLGNFTSDPRWAAYVADLPKQGKSQFMLSFSGSTALYEIDETNKTVLPQKLQNALGKANYGKEPEGKTQQVYFDFNQGQQTEQIVFMTRNFQVSSAIAPQAWKLTSKKKKVLNYICIGAEITRDNEVHTAWFTSEIPISGGPADYSGLPGLVLAVEKNEEVFILATKVDLSVQPDNLKAKLKDGKKMSKEKFDQTVAEKVEEFKESLKNKSTNGAAKRLGGKGQ